MQYVLSAHNRRNLTPSQRAASAVYYLPLLEKEAKKNQGTRTDLNIVEKIPQSESGKSRDKAGQIVGVNPRYITDAKKLKEENPEVFEEVRLGKKTLQQAKRETIPARVVNLEHIILGEYAENEVRKDFNVKERIEIGKAVEETLQGRRGGDTSTGEQRNVEYLPQCKGNIPKTRGVTLPEIVIPVIIG